MNIKIYTNHETFLERALPYMEAHEGSNSLMLGVALNLEHHLERCQPFMALVEEDGRVIVAALQTPPYNVIIHAVDTVADEALQLLIPALRDAEHPVPGVIGPKTVALRFSNLWHQATGQTVTPGMAMRSYQLKEVRMPQDTPDKFRAAAPQDRPQLSRWIGDFEAETGVSGPSADPEAWADRAIAEDRVFVWEVDGRAVTMAAQTRPTRRSRSVNAVYTPPEHRRRGYASACVAHLSQHILDSGYDFAALFTDLKNPTSNKIYMNVGYEPVCDVSEYIFSGEK